MIVEMCSKKRMHTMYEMFLLLFFITIAILSLFPQLLDIIEDIFGMSNLILTLLCFGVFAMFIICFSLYQKMEQQRREITVLAQEIGYLNEKLRVLKKK